MRRLSPGVLIENQYPGVILGVSLTEDGYILLDSPYRVEDGRNWIMSLGKYGKPRFLVLLDVHPDRVLGARGLGLRIVGHDWTRQEMNGWSDSFKGNANPIGADVDELKRVTGVRRAIPELSFSERMLIQQGGREIHLIHRPGPTPGSIWVVFPDERIAFIGDTVTVAEPPYIGHADVDAWQRTLTDLRELHSQSYVLVSSRDGLIDRDDINAMGRFLRKIPPRVQRISEGSEPLETAAKLALQLMKGYKVIPDRQEKVLLRLQSGLSSMHNRLFPQES
jgi:glyoxylase-like metal-dependent hydrolase (beta-lactamase superfamily II)